MAIIAFNIIGPIAMLSKLVKDVMFYDGYKVSITLLESEKATRNTISGRLNMYLFSIFSHLVRGTPFSSRIF
jgi:hypothetical protein